MYYELLGFDVRLCSGDYVQARWDWKSRTTFLLRPEIQWPLSVDDEVWPSVFDEFEEAELPTNSLRPSLWLWFNLAAMQAFLMTQKRVQNQHGVRIAVELVTKESVRSDDYWSGVLYPYDVLSPSAIPLEWLFLGYDVADQYQLSGLTNCGYDENERVVLPAIWAARLNEHGL